MTTVKRQQVSLENLSQRIKSAVDETVERINQSAIQFIYPTFYPQRAEFEASLGLKNLTIVGGPVGDEAYPGIRQVGIPTIADTRGIAETADNLTKIVAAFPTDISNAGKRLILASDFGHEWEKFIIAQHPGVEIVATSGGHASLFFEEKTNLQKLLRMAGLQKYSITTKVVPHSIRSKPRQLAKIYNDLADPHGRIVVQSMGAGFCESGGGKGTHIVATAEEFIYDIQNRETDLKAVKFVEGQAANITLFAGNLSPSPTSWGTIESDLPSGINVHNPDSLYTIRKHAARQGIDANTIFYIGGGATLKGIGLYPLTVIPGSGIGNIVLYTYLPHIRRQIQEIQTKLGTFLALCGARTLINIDVIIRHDGQVKINEVNFRPGGPTAFMSSYASQQGIPSLKAITFLAHYADFHDKKIQKLFRDLKEYNQEITERYLTTSGPFYLKFNTVHKKSRSALQEFSSGIYSARYNHNQKKWLWSKDHSNQIREIPSFEKDLKRGSFRLNFAGGKITQNKPYPSGIQLLRLIGSGPALIENKGLNPLLIKPIEDLYQQTFGEHVLRTHPLKQNHT